MLKRIVERKGTLDLLEDIYHFRALTLEQIKYVYYPDSKDYINKRMSLLVRSNLLESVRFGRGVCYQITQEGIEMLVESRRLQNPRRVRDNNPEKKELNRIISANDVYTYLTPFGFVITEMREWKREHNINRNAWVCAGVDTADGLKRYSVYLLHDDLRNDDIFRIQSEIEQAKDVMRYIFIFRKIDVFKAYAAKMTNTEKGLLELLMVSERDLRVVLPLFASEKSYVDLYERFGEVERNNIQSSKTSFAEHLLRTPDGQEYYVCNFLLMDMTKFEQVQAYEYDGHRKIAFFAFSHGVRFFQQEIGNRDYVEYFTIDYSDIESYAELSAHLNKRREEIEERNRRRVERYREERRGL